MSTLESHSLADLLDRIASKTPTPGGGAVAPVVGALAAALARMVVAYSLGRKSLAAHEADLRRADQTLAGMRPLLLQLAEEDAAAFEALGPLLRLPPNDPGRAGIGDAARTALQPPRATLAACANLLHLLEDLAPITNRQLHSDLAIAAVLAEAAAKASAWNVRVNLPLLADTHEQAQITAEAHRLLEESGQRRVRVEAACSG